MLFPTASPPSCSSSPLLLLPLFLLPTAPPPTAPSPHCSSSHCSSSFHCSYSSCCSSSPLLLPTASPSTAPPPTAPPLVPQPSLLLPISLLSSCSPPLFLWPIHHEPKAALHLAAAVFLWATQMKEESSFFLQILGVFSLWSHSLRHTECTHFKPASLSGSGGCRHSYIPQTGAPTALVLQT